MDANSINLTIRVMRRTESDIIGQLEKQPTKAAYIKRLIRADIAAEKAAQDAAERPED